MPFAGAEQLRGWGAKHRAAYPQVPARHLARLEENTMPDNVLACNLNSYGKFRDGAFAHLQRLGVRHVEIAAPLPAEVPATLERLQRHGLSATSVIARCDVSEDAGVDAFAAPVDAAHALGARVIFASVKADPIPMPDVCRRLRAMGEVAGARGITLALETHPDLAHNGDIALQTMRAIDHPGVRINYDTGNVYYYNEGIDGIVELRKILDYVAAVHLKDTSGAYRTWHFPTLGQGVCDFPALFRLLNGRGFYGPFTLELEGIRDENLDEVQTQQRVADSVAYLRKIGAVP
jgi:sugar phosphate isomerase/epimerase